MKGIVKLGPIKDALTCAWPLESWIWYGKKENGKQKKRKIAINKNDKDLRDEIETCRLEETTLDYMLYIILEFAGKLI